MKKPNVLDDTVNCVDYDGYTHAVIKANVINIINDIIDDIKKLKEEWAEYDKKFAAWVESINVHERAIDKLQMALEPEKCEVKDPYAEQRRWEGKLCWFWDADPEDKIVDVLSCIDISDKYPYVMCDHQIHYKHCKPVKPDDDIIYKKEQQ